MVKILAVLSLSSEVESYFNTSNVILVNLKIVFCVVEADVFHHLSHQFQVVGDQPVFDVVAEDIAQDAAEVLVPRIGQETP